MTSSSQRLHSLWKDEETSEAFLKAFRLVYRAGQREMRERAARQGWLETFEFYDDADIFIRALSLEGDDD